VKKFFLIVLACIMITDLMAQDNPSQTPPNQQPQYRDKKSAKRERINNMLKMEEEGELIFNKHSIFGIRLFTDGYGISYEKGKFITNSKTRILQFELNEKKSPKDHKVATGYFNGYNFNSVVIGKLNNLYEFKASIGQQFLVGGKGNKNGVAVTALYTGGLSLGILKPYYYDVATADNDEIRLKYPQILDSDFTQSITGASGFTYGWNQASVRGGLNAKLGMRFDYGRFNQSITAIETGITGEYYFGSVPLMWGVKEKHFFFNAFVSIMFGKRK